MHTHTHTHIHTHTHTHTHRHTHTHTHTHTRTHTNPCARANTDAIIADLSQQAEAGDPAKPQEQLVHSNGLTGAAFGFGFIVGPALGGFILSRFGAKAVFCVAASMMTVCCLITLLLMRESIPLARRRSHISVSDATPLRGLGILARDRRIFLLACSHSLDKVGFMYTLPRVLCRMSTSSCFWLLTTRYLVVHTSLETAPTLSGFSLRDKCVRIRFPGLGLGFEPVQDGRNSSVTCLATAKMTINFWSFLIATV